MLTKVALFGFAVSFVALGPAARESALAQSVTLAAVASPSPSPSPSPTPPPKKVSRLHVGIDSYTSGTNQQFVGPGITGGTEAASPSSFINGGPLGSSVPYDFFSGGPETTGESISQDILITPTYRLFPTVDVAATFGYGSVGGAGNVGAYWGDSLMPTINPHLGSQAASLTPQFTTHNGQDPINASRISVLSGSIALHDGSGALSGGWFNQHQSVDFVFEQAPLTNTPFELAPQIPQSLGDGSAAVPAIANTAGELPLHGYDAWGKINSFTFEASNADLPAPAGNMARETSLSGIYATGDVKISAEFAHLNESGAISGRFAFGSNVTYNVDGAAVVPFSTLTGQRMAIGGIGAVFPLADADSEVRYAHSCYAGDGVAIPTTSCTGGNYYYAKFHQGFSKFDLALEFVRFEPTYAPAVLSYGTIENVWQAPFAFPGTFLNGDYQLVSNREVGANRQGIRASSTFIIAGVETRVAYARYGQVAAYDLSTAPQSGFIEPFFSPQLTSTQGVKGTETHASAWFAWHPKLLDVTLELSDVIANRYAPANRPEDAIAMDYPSYVLSLSRQFKKILFGVGAGRYAVQGSWDTVGTINASLSQNVVFTGLQLQSNANSAYGIEYSIFSVNGVPLIPTGLSPAYHGPQIQFYQRLKT